ncbi:MAG: PKD-like domain-containing protein, partial [Bacteroidales bacterium]|nr:PKD-like domain-containing protein [Bacteroidales bacterium]
MKKSLLYLTLTVLILFGCNTGREITLPPAPQIELDSETGVYSVKAGRTICITPIVSYAEDAVYTWTVSNNIVSREKELNFTAGQPGSVYVTLKVTNENGADSEDLRIDVLALAPPVISLAVPDSGFSIAPDSLLTLKPLISNSEKATCLWKVDSVAVANTLEYVFSSAVTGTFSVALECENEDGKDGISFSISVIRPIADEPGEEDPGEENPDDDEPGDDNPGDEDPGTGDPGNENPGNDGPG